MFYDTMHNVYDVGDVIWKFYSNFRLELNKYGWDVVKNISIWILLYFLLYIIMYILLDRYNGYSSSNLKNVKRCLFVIAHPDDECMFFGPTIIHLQKQNVEIHLLCLSQGNYYGYRSVRLKELYEACRVLGIKECHMTVYNDTCLPDNPEVEWPAKRTASIIQHHVDSMSIDALVTFDKEGVSYHSNHKSIFYAVALLSLEKKIPSGCRIYTLDTVNILRKYWGYMDLPLSFLFSSNRFVLSPKDRNLLVSAMKEHKSQMLWFRRLYLLFSRFIVINTLKEVNLTDFELELELDE